MGFYRERVFPRVMNVLMDTKETRRVRAEVCAPLSGEVLELGFGTGLNLPHLPAAVTALLAVDPMERGRDLGAGRLTASAVPVSFVGLDGQRLPLDDDSVDAALCTWTLCSIPDPVAAVREVARVLRPGGRLHFAEHGRSPDPGVLRWQRRFDGLQQRVACGCSLTTDVPAVLAEGGLAVEALRTYAAAGEPKPWGWTFQGVAA